MATRRSRIVLSCAVLTSLTAVATAGAAGAAAPARTTGSSTPTTIVVYSSPHGEVRIAGPEQGDKSALLTPIDRVSPASGYVAKSPYPTRTQWLYPAGSGKVTPPGGDEGKVLAEGATQAQVPFLEYYAIFGRTTARVAWTGTRPYTADSVQQTDCWQVDYVGAAYQVVGAPDGASVASDGGSACWSTTEPNTWYSEHTWDSIGFTPVGFGYLYRVRFTETGTFQFGSAFFKAQGTSSAEQ